MKKLEIIADAWKRYVNYAWVYECEKYIEEYNKFLQKILNPGIPTVSLLVRIP